MSGIDQFRDTQPLFLPEKFFDGSIEGWMVFETLLGALRRRATISGKGVWNQASQSLVLSELYTFDGGLTDQYNWTIYKLREGRYSGTETRLKGQARGKQAGCAFHWKYNRNTPQPDGSSVLLNFDDWAYAIDEQVCIVRATVRRAGLPFATAHVTYRRL